MHLRQVPKVLGLLRSAWAPGAFLVSFKLETDEEILMEKAGGAIEKARRVHQEEAICLALCRV